MTTALNKHTMEFNITDRVSKTTGGIGTTQCRLLLPSSPPSNGTYSYRTHIHNIYTHVHNTVELTLKF
jgi:hypothetical protein